MSGCRKEGRRIRVGLVLLAVVADYSQSFVVNPDRGVKRDIIRFEQKKEDLIQCVEDDDDDESVEVYAVKLPSLEWLQVTKLDARARADVARVLASEEKIRLKLSERIKSGLIEFFAWTSFMVRANAMGLTTDLNVPNSLGERLKIFRIGLESIEKAKNPIIANDELVFEEEIELLEDDWAAIHTPSEEGGEMKAAEYDEDFDVVNLTADEWAEITSQSFEVDTQIVYDTVIKGQWSVKNGRCHFAQATTDDAFPHSSSAAASLDYTNNDEMNSSYENNNMPSDDELAAFRDLR